MCSVYDAKKRERRRKKDRQRYHCPKRQEQNKAKHARWRKSPKGIAYKKKYDKAYIKNNPEKRKATQDRYYKNHHEDILKRQRERYRNAKRRITRDVKHTPT
ncbi:hypothetical protein H8E88_19370 [candidate division KSB1 bacterium]|nr:hypothetical protein [candidate division KSB1 bacterium]